MLLDFLWERYIGLMVGFTCFRYLFLGIPAFLYLKGVKGKSIIPLVIISMIYLVLMLYSNVPLYADPILPDGWEAQTCLGYFYTLALFFIIVNLYLKSKTSKLKQYITHVGTISWEIFLIQMVLIGSGVLNTVSSRLFNSSYLHLSFTVISALFISLLLAEIYKKILDCVFKIS